jgi:hypothetical protein
MKMHHLNYLNSHRPISSYQCVILFVFRNRCFLLIYSYNFLPYYAFVHLPHIYLYVSIQSCYMSSEKVVYILMNTFTLIVLLMHIICNCLENAVMYNKTLSNLCIFSGCNDIDTLSCQKLASIKRDMCHDDCVVKACPRTCGKCCNYGFLNYYYTV